MMLVGMVFYFTFQYIQTEQFANTASHYVEKYITKKYNLKIKFSRIKLGAFPPATKLENVSVLLKTGEEYKAELVEARFGISDIFTKTTSIGELIVRGTELEIRSSSNDEEKFELERFFENVYQKQLSKYPVKIKKVQIQDSLIRYNKKRYWVNHLRAGLYRNLITLDFSIDNLLSVFESDIELKDNSVEASIQVSKNYLRITEANIYEGLSDFYLFGKVEINKNKYQFNNFNIKSNIYSQKVVKHLPQDIKNVLESVKANLSFSIVLNGDVESPKVESEIEFKELYSKMWSAESGSVSFVKEEGLSNLRIEKFRASKNNGSIELTDSFLLVSNGSLNKKIITKGKLNNLFTNDLLSFLPSLDPFKANVNGEFFVELLDVRYLKIRPSENSYFSNTRLNFKNPTDSIHLEKNLVFKNNSIAEIDFEKDVKINAFTEIGESRFDVEATLNDRSVEAIFKMDMFRSIDIGKVAGVKYEGSGALSGRIKSNYDDISLFIDTKFKELKFLNTNFGEISGPVDIDLKNMTVNLEKLQGQYESIKYKSKGVVNLNKEKLDIRFRIGQGNLEDFKKMVPYVFSPINNYLDHVRLNMPGELRVFGGISLKELKVAGKISGENLNIINEDFERAKFSFNYDSEKINFYNIELFKIGGRITGKFKYLFPKNRFEYQGSISGIKLMDFNFYKLANLGYSGDVYGELYGSGTSADFATRSQVRISNGSIGSLAVQDSLLTVYNNGDDLFATGNIIGNRISFDSYVNLSKKSVLKNSYVKGFVRTQDIKEILGLYSKHNVLDNSIRGEIDSKVDIKFSPNDIENLDIEYIVNKLNYERKDIEIDIESRDNFKIEVADGIIKNWSLALTQKGISFNSKGSGRVFQNAKINTNLTSSGTMFELLSSKIERAGGQVGAKHFINVENGNVKSYFENKCENCFVNLENLPGSISEIKYTVIFDNNRMLLKNFNGSYGGGKIVADGNAELRFPFPRLNIRSSLRDVRIPILKKSNIVVNSDLRLVGDKIPYVLTGDITLIHGEVLDELEELASSAMTGGSYQRFVPKAYVKGGVGIVKNDFKLNIINPVSVKNSLLDLKINGDVDVSGTLLSPFFNGEVGIVGTESKITFKGHEFILSKGRVKFLDQNRKEKPDINFEGKSQINEYDISLVVSGSVDKLIVDMNSSPPLSQENILSLLTIGVTNDVSKSLGDRERQSVTTLSIGSLLVDQLKINQNLNENLGLRLSVQPEITESDTSLLEGRADGSQGGAGSNIKSSTKIKIQKKISKKVDLSVSSTIGGTSAQKQKMNINYNISKKWSVEGTYEIKAGEEAEEESSDSLGADLKFRWSFD